MQLGLAEVEGLAERRKGDDECAVHEDLPVLGSTWGCGPQVGERVTYIKDSDSTHGENEKSVVQDGRHPAEERAEEPEAEAGKEQLCSPGPTRAVLVGRGTSTDSSGARR